MDGGLLRRDDALTAPNLTRRYLEARLRGRRNEVFVAVFRDSRHQPIAYEELFNGTVDGATVHPRVVVRRALMHNAAALVIGHPEARQRHRSHPPVSGWASS